MKKIIFSLFILLVGLQGKAELNLFALSPDEKRINELQLPRNEYTLYRGLNEAQLDLQKAARAMLGDSTANIESPIFFTVKQKLMGEAPSLTQRFPGIEAELSQLGTDREIEETLRRNNGPIQDERKAIHEVKRLLDKTYDLSWALKNIIDYLSPSRNDFPLAFLFSSVYVDVAKIYASSIVVFRDTNTKRSLDVNYWNYSHHHEWVHTNLSYPDKGEFVSPFYIPHHQIIGYQYRRSNYSTDWNIWRPLQRDLGLILMKKAVQGSDYLYILDAAGLTNVISAGDQFCGFQTEFSPEAPVPAIGKADCRVKPKLIAIMRACAQKRDCAIPKSLYKGYEISAGDEYQRELQKLKNLKIEHSLDPLYSAPNSRN